jgi:hypothetical protein
MPWFAWPLLVVAIPLFVAVAWVVAAVVLLTLVWLTWLPRGRCALVVYSSSPVWRLYFETTVLPAVGRRAAVLNWSERKRWGYSVPVLLFRMFGGQREFNPLAMVFRPFRWPQRFRFYTPFVAFKHGRPGEVQALTREFLDALEPSRPKDAV